MSVTVVKCYVRQGRMFRSGTAASVRTRKHTYGFKRLRRLHGTWTIEPAQELEAWYNEDLIDELTAILTDELTK